MVGIQLTRQTLHAVKCLSKLNPEVIPDFFDAYSLSNVGHKLTEDDLKTEVTCSYLRIQ